MNTKRNMLFHVKQKYEAKDQSKDDKTKSPSSGEREAEIWRFPGIGFIVKTKKVETVGDDIENGLGHGHLIRCFASSANIPHSG